MNKPEDFPRILVFGRMGQVGWELQRTLACLGAVIAVDYPEVDFTQPDSIRVWIDRTEPDLIVNAAAYTAVDKAESDAERCHEINAEAPGVLAEAAKRRGALLVHYSTDYVFDGTKGGSYVEDDVPNPLGVYGQSKLAGDRAVAEAGGLHLIFRLCWVYGVRGQNFMLTMMRLARERETLRVVQDQVGCPTWSRLIAEATALTIQRWLGAPDRDALTGVYHLAASTSTSWHGFARAIIDRMSAEGKKCQQVQAITTPEYPTPAKRPACSVLDCGKLERTFGIRLPSWEEGLEMAMADRG